jgi:hypothetical protein
MRSGGKGEPPVVARPQAHDPSPVKMPWDAIFIDADQLDATALFSLWPHTVEGVVALIGASAFGDLFFQRRDGSIHRLDVLEGGTKEIADTHEAFAALMNTRSWRDEHLLTEGVALLIERGVKRGRAQFYAFAPHPAFTGKIDWHRVMVMDARVWHALCAQILDAPGKTEKAADS